MSRNDDSLVSVGQSLIEDKQLQRYVNARSKNTDEAAEVYQEVIARVIERARESTIVNPLAYAIRVAKNLLLATRKTETHDDDIEWVSCAASNPERSLSAQQNLELIEQALRLMPPLRKKVFVMRRLHGRTREDIARTLALSPEAVSKHVTRAMADIQQYIDRNS